MATFPNATRVINPTLAQSRAVAAAVQLPRIGAALVMAAGIGALILGPWGARGGLWYPQGSLMMVPTTAVALVSAAAALRLLLRYRESHDRVTLHVSRGGALLCALLGLVAMLRYALAWESVPDAGTIYRGLDFWLRRSAPNTALALALIGTSLLGLSVRRERAWRLARRLAAISLVVALMAVVGHAYGAGALYGLNSFGGMSLSAALAVATLAIGILFADPWHGVAAIIVSDSAGGRLLRRLAPAAILIPPVLGWFEGIASSAGLSAPFGRALLVVTFVVVFLWLLVSQAAALHASDLERTRLHAAESTARADAESARVVAEQSRREADEANRAKSAFLATMSHEIRTPINAILGYAQLIELGVAGPVTDQQRDYLARLAATSEHLRGLVDDVLDLSKVDAGGMDVARGPGVTGPLVAAALDLVRPQANAKGVRLVDANPDGPGASFVGDDHRIRQILANLLSNAVKFTDARGTVTVDCGTRDGAPGATELRGEPSTFVRVTDTGIGIPAEQHRRIFDPFHQVDHGNTRRQGGTGLGLTISRRFARLMGGDLTVESTPGVGSTFTLWLPVSHEAAAARDGGGRARPRTQTGVVRVHGLAEIGTLLRERVEDVLAAHGARLRADPATPNARDLRRSELENHQLSFLADIAQTLVVVEETGGVESDLLRDGSTIQRVVAELHGAMRRRRGFSEVEFDREYEILGEEVEAVVRRHVPEGAGDVSLALDVLHRLIERARTLGLAALRREDAVERPDTRDDAAVRPRPGATGGAST